MDLEVVLDTQDGGSLALDDAEIVSLIKLVLESQNIQRTCSVSVSTVSDEKMAQLNGEWRNVPAPTDVLSFECEHPWDPDLVDDEVCMLGDIVLAPDFLARQSVRMNTTQADETRLMIVHATLHLLGYDHVEEQDMERMQRFEDDLLARIVQDGTLTHVVLSLHREDEA